MGKPDPQVQIGELILVNSISIDALITVLERKGLLKRDDVLKEVDAVKKQIDDRARQN